MRLALALGLAQRRQQQGRQNGNDGDDHEQLDQSERPDVLGESLHS